MQTEPRPRLSASGDEASGLGTTPRLRERFPILETATYLVSHSMGAAPLGAREALDRYWQQWADRGPEAWRDWLGEIAEIGDGIGELFGAPPGTVSLSPNVSTVMGAIASCLDFRGDRREVVFEDLQFPSVAYVWTAWERFGAKIVTVASDGRSVSTDAICSAIGERTAVVVISHAAYQSGSIVDVAAVQARCRETGALFVLDAYQTIGAYPFDATELGLDVVTGGSHKWLCGGGGCGFVYVAPHARERLAPALTGWMAHADPFAFEPPPMRLAETQHRWNTGTPSMPAYIVARAGHDALREVGMPDVRARNLRLTQRLIDGAQARGFTIPTPLDPARRTGWIGMDFAGADRACAALVARRIFVDYRPGCGIRVSPHFYTTDEEIETFLRILDDSR